MCGRFGFAKGIDDFSKKFHIPMKERYNIAPSQEVVVVEDTFKATKLKWGFQQNWSSTSKLLINARIETLDQKLSFKNYKKCLIPASGWYEWASIGGARIPYYFTTSADWFYMAGIEVEGLLIVLTKQADDQLHHIHDRMPLVFSNTYDQMWETNQINHNLALSIKPYAITTLINKVSYDHKDVVTPKQYPVQGNLFN